MTSTYTASSTQLQQAQLLITDLLQHQDYFNVAKIDQIQLLIAGHTDYFEAKIWQQQLKQQEKIHAFFTDFLNFYLNNFQLISDAYTEQLKIESNKMAQIFAQNPQLFYLEKMIIQEENTNIINEVLFESSAGEMQSLEKLMLVNYWLQAFTPFAEHNIPLVWHAFKKLPDEAFPLVLNISPSNLEPQDIKIFYQLFAQDKLNFSTAEGSPTSYIQNFYDQFPELLAQVPKLFEQTASSHLKENLLMCLSHRQSQLSVALQQFILSNFIQSNQDGSKQIFDASLHALAKCQQIEIPHKVIQKLKQLLHDDEVWYVPIVAMQVLSALGVREAWFKQHLLDALDNPYGCDGETPQGASLEILISWGEQGLYATDKITQLLKQAIAKDEQEDIKNLTVYMDAYPQLAKHFHSLLWQMIEGLSQKPLDECWIEGKTLKTFLQLSEWCNWQPNTQQWAILEKVLQGFLEYLDPKEREEHFALLVQHVKLNSEIMQSLRQWCVDKDIENQSFIDSEDE